MSRETVAVVLIVLFLVVMAYDKLTGPGRCVICRGFTCHERCPVGRRLSRKDKP
jgi:hypothetical protein